eukprot:TRINITY_DN4406_c0_g1_i6.p8 TRINITY_DN4406_c0_g1~~TRINITY_DN4406_c0_g1_i6.p8  ORF type:complete len:137 (-),score=2.02 TRINITY_DN4406_c0_g1_i6:1402-1812(-)
MLSCATRDQNFVDTSLFNVYYYFKLKNARKEGFYFMSNFVLFKGLSNLRRTKDFFSPFATIIIYKINRKTGVIILTQYSALNKTDQTKNICLVLSPFSEVVCLARTCITIFTSKVKLILLYFCDHHYYKMDTSIQL